MMGKQFMKQAECFVDTALEIGDKLKSFTLDADSKKEKIDSAMQKLVQKVGATHSDLEKGDPFEDKIITTREGLLHSLKEWRSEVENFTKSYNFMRENEKNMLVMVFGAVKAGKSSLGNFLAGKKFIELEDENVYKRIFDNPKLRPQFKIEEEGREGNLEGGWFREGFIDTTGAIQYFTLGGMKWLDSPGTGAVRKVGDTLEMEPLVAKYLNDIDFGVFLMSSEQPGLTNDFLYIQEMYLKKKPIMVVITKSDNTVLKKTNSGIAKDAQGRPIKVSVPKDLETRKKQEDYIRKQAKEYGVNDLDVLSVSVKLAKDALETNDEKMFSASNMDKFYARLSECIGENAAELKMNTPRYRINNLIDGIIDGVDTQKAGVRFKGLHQKISELNSLKREFEEKQSEIKELEKRIVGTVKRNVENDLTVRFEKIKQEFNNSKAVNLNNFGKEVKNLVNEESIKALNDEINKIIIGFDCGFISFNEDYNVDIKEKFTEHKKELKYVNYVRREPDGIFETVCSWFGKEYYSEKRQTKTVIEKIKTGDNVFDEYNKLVQQLDNSIQLFIHKELEHLSTSYYAKQIAMLNDLVDDLTIVKNEIISLKVGEDK